MNIGEESEPVEVPIPVHPDQIPDAPSVQPEPEQVIYRDLAADDDRTRQITADVAAALAQGRHCLVLTQRIAHLQKLADALQSMGHDPVPA
jgi:hypothetical protein